MDSKTTGDYGETLCASHYMRNGYKVLERNYKTQMGEIDLIVEKCGIMAFVEVKTRKAGGYMRPAEAVTLQKQKRLINAALHYIGQYRISDDVMMRFDVVEVELQNGCRPAINVIESAFTL